MGPWPGSICENLGVEILWPRKSQDWVVEVGIKSQVIGEGLTIHSTPALYKIGLTWRQVKAS